MACSGGAAGAASAILFVVNRAHPIQLVATPLRAELSSGLAPIDFADCYHAQLQRRGLTALQVAHAMFADPPGWIRGLMAARDAVVGRLGLKTAQAAGAGGAKVGIFPLRSERPEEVVLGLDDRHLDFRIWVSVREAPHGSDVWMSTLVRYNGVSGRIYLFLIMPLHKLLSRHMLKRAARFLGG
jgi:hypothetical protein